MLPGNSANFAAIARLPRVSRGRAHIDVDHIGNRQSPRHYLQGRMGVALAAKVDDGSIALPSSANAVVKQLSKQATCHSAEPESANFQSPVALYFLGV